MGARDAESPGLSVEVHRRAQRSLSDGQYDRQLDDEDGGCDRREGGRTRGPYRRRWIGGDRRAKGYYKSADDTRNSQGKIDESVPGGDGIARGPAGEKLADHFLESTGHPDIPPVFVVNGQLPDVAPPLSAQGDGPTIHVILIFRATPQLCRYAAKLWASDPRSQAAGTSSDDPGHDFARDCRGTFEGSMRRSTSDGGKIAEGGGGGGETTVPESVPLLAEWMRRAADDGDFRGRFKAIGDVINMDEVHDE